MPRNFILANHIVVVYIQIFRAVECIFFTYTLVLLVEILPIKD